MRQIAGWVTVVTMLSLVSWAAGADGTRCKVEEKKLGPCEPEHPYFVIADDLSHYAFQLKRPDKKVVVVTDGQTSPAYDEVNGLGISPDGSRVIYAAKSAGRAFAVIDSKPTTQYDSVDVGSSSISRNGKHVAYLASADKGKTRVLAVDGETKPLPATYWGWWALSPDFKHLACLVLKAGKQHMELDGQEGPKFDSIDGSLGGFSANGEHLAYVAKDGQKACVVLDSQPGPVFDKIVGYKPCFSPDGKRLAYIAQNAKKQYVVVDGKAGPEFDSVDNYSVVFSPDSKHLVYWAGKNGKTFKVLDGQSEPVEHKQAGSVTFSPDGKRLAYLAHSDKGSYIVLDDKIATDFQSEPAAIRFTADSKHWAYSGQGDKGKVLYYLDGRPGPLYDDIQDARFNAANELEFLAVRDKTLYRVKQTL